VLCLGKDEAELKEESKYIADILKKKEAHVLGPTQDVVYKVNNTYRYKIYVKSPNDKLLMSYADIIREDMKKRMVKGIIVQFKL
jgi:primosomal protein N'